MREKLDTRSKWLGRGALNLQWLVLSHVWYRKAGNGADAAKWSAEKARGQLLWPRLVVQELLSLMMGLWKSVRSRVCAQVDAVQI